ncbi:MAG: hypothetical protein KGH98_02185 [Candidatus Micrarchaeota archaeon]|nr:hypothetical protein [Candidatus Micrarchaeota archaeon]
MAAEPVEETKTTIDSLMELVKAKGRMELSATAAALGADPKVVESWAKVLEQGNMVRVVYEMGRMYIEPTSLTPEQAKTMVSKATTKLDIVESDLAAQSLSLEKLSELLDRVKASTQSVDKLYQQRMPDMRVKMTELNRMTDALQKQIATAEQSKGGIDGLYETVNKRVNELTAKIDALDPSKAAGVDSGRDARIKDSIDKVNQLEKEIENLSREKDRRIDALKKDISSHVSELNGMVDSSRKEMSEKLKGYAGEIRGEVNEMRDLMKSAATLHDQIRQFDKEKQGFKVSLESARTDFNNRYQKTHDEIGANVERISAQAKALMEQISAFKEGMGEASKLYDQINESKAEIERIQKDITALKAEVDKSAEEAKLIRAMAVSAAEKKEQRVEELEAKARSTKNRSSKLKSDLENVAKRIGGDQK